MVKIVKGGVREHVNELNATSQGSARGTVKVESRGRRKRKGKEGGIGIISTPWKVKIWGQEAKGLPLFRGMVCGRPGGFKD